jgi:hypothetical protein
MSAASSRRVFRTIAELKMLLMDWKALTRIGGAAVIVQIWTTAHLVYVRVVRYNFSFLYTMVLMLSHAMHVYQDDTLSTSVPFVTRRSTSHKSNAFGPL